MKNYKIYKIGWVKTSNVEIKDLFKAWMGISIAFGIAFSGLSFSLVLLWSILIAVLVVGTAFLFHELAHKIVAQKYRYPAEFRAFDEMIFLAIIMSFFGFVLAAPGAVMIKAKQISKKTNGIISLAGPATNIVLAFLFFLIFKFLLPQAGSIVINEWSLDQILIKVNGFIALFNLIPVWLFDGAKIFKWSKFIWFIMVLLGLITAFMI